MNTSDPGLGAEAAEIARLSAEYDALFLLNAGYPHPRDDEQNFEDVLAKAAKIAKGDIDEARRLIEVATQFPVDELEHDRFLNVVKQALGAGARLDALRNVWNEAAREARTRATLASQLNTAKPKDDAAVRLEDFVAYMQSLDYIYTPAGDFWPAARVDARLPSVKLFDKSGNPIIDEETGRQKEIFASDWLAKHAPVEQMTWAPGLPQLVRDKLIGDGSWIDRKGATVFNLYRPPIIVLGDPSKAGPWLDHVRRIYPDEADHIIAFLAHRVQRPEEKINHGLVLGGLQGIGKDTLLEPFKRAVGPWNFAEVSPQQVLGRFNGFLKSVVLRISEAKDTGEVDRFKFYAHMKSIMAAPPDVLRVDEKNLREYSVFNVCGVVMTTNHKTDGVYLPADDRRHYVTWSEAKKEEFPETYWKSIWAWYEEGGYGHVAAYLAELDLSGFNPKAPPPKTGAFWAIVDANRAPEDAELADVLDKLGRPDAVALDMLVKEADFDFYTWLRDGKNRRNIPHRLEQCGYIPVRNDAADDGLFKINNRRQAVYARTGLSFRGRLEAVRKLTNP
jgi:Family of unknown function (DUF5906)